jgi:hypothetical protein
MAVRLLPFLLMLQTQSSSARNSFSNLRSTALHTLNLSSPTARTDGASDSKNSLKTQICPRCACRPVGSTSFHAPPSISQEASCNPCLHSEELNSQTFVMPMDECFRQEGFDQGQIDRCWGEPLRRKNEKVLWVLGDSKVPGLSLALKQSVKGYTVKGLSAWAHNFATETVSDPAVSQFARYATPGDILVWMTRSFDVDNIKTGLEKLASKLSKASKAKNIRFVIFEDYPRLACQLPQECVSDKPGPTACAVPATSSLNGRFRVNVPDAEYFDLGRLMCDSQHCDMYIPGTRIVGVSDSSHLNVAGLNYVAPFICNILS